jgi:hypothetical protein
MRIAYADPPYSGLAAKYGRREVNMPKLIKALDSRFDGWAFSCHVRGMLEVAPILPKGARVGAWCKTWVAFHKGVFPPHSWEPVIFKPARKRDLGSAETVGVRDWHSSAANMNGFFGSKPPEFCGWLFSILGMEPEDDFHDLFHGSGAVKRAWAQWRACKKAGGPLFVKPA